MSISYGGSIAFIICCCLIGLIWAIINYWIIRKITVDVQSSGTILKGEPQSDLNSKNEDINKISTLLEIGYKIQDGAKAFLHQEYLYCGIFALLMAIGLILVVSWYCAIAFIIGAFTSMLCGYIGMMIATYSNYRTSYMAMQSLPAAFQVAYRAGCVIGFSLVSISLGILLLIIVIYVGAYLDESIQFSNPSLYFEQMSTLFDYVAGYGLGGSTVALFGRVGGGIYTKAADVGADLVGKVEHDLPEDSPRNPATIADNVGDNVGDIAGMGADLFGSFAESTCAALVVSASQLKFPSESDNESLTTSVGVLMYPLLLSAAGLLICIFTSFIGIYVTKVYRTSQIEQTLKLQLFISTLLLTPLIYGVAHWVIPQTFYMTESNIIDSSLIAKNPSDVYICSMVGVWGGLLIGLFTEYMTSHRYSPVREVAKSCTTGAATNIIYGLALGYQSTAVPIIIIAFTAYLGLYLLSYYGVALCSLGMLSNLAIGLAIDGYGPISDNAGGIAEMSQLGSEIREITDALDAAGNTTAAVGKGFAIGSAALVSLSLFGGFITRVYQGNQNLTINTEIIDPLVFAFLLIGSMLPYIFSAFTMKSVGKAALEMVFEVRRQLQSDPRIKTGESEPDFRACIEISTKASLKEMIAPALLVIGSPILAGLLFGPQAILGLLPGSLISGVQMAIASANTGGAWDNAKKYIESGSLIDEKGDKKGKGSNEHKAAVIGDTVGDPMKDTSGPALNILIKLMAILSLVLADYFKKTGYIAKYLNNL